MISMEKEFGSDYASIADVNFKAKYRASCYCNAVQYEVCSDPVDAKVVRSQKSKLKIRLIRDIDQIIPLSVTRGRCESLICFVTKWVHPLPPCDGPAAFQP
jgi:hypothetical protein